MLQHRMEIYGLCSECLAERMPLIPLGMAKPGETVIVREVMGRRHARARLASLGLRPGDILEIIKNDGQGRLIIGHGSTRLAMGWGIAQKIMVSFQRE